MRPEAPELTAAALGPITADSWPVFTQLRREYPVAWHEAGGHWLLTAHREVHDVSIDSVTFSSAGGILPLEIGIEYPSPPTMMHTDAPLHTIYRQLVAPAFRPSRMRALQAEVERTARRLVDTLDAGDAVDVVKQLCVPFPLFVIAALLGIPEDRWEQFFFWSEATIPDALDLTDEERMNARNDMVAFMLSAAHARRSDPRDDLISDLATAEIDGQVLSDDELMMFLDQLLVAGNETTRNLLSGSIVAVAEVPGTWERLGADRSLLPLAVEEFLRWTTPVVGFMRTATKPVDLRGVQIEAGEAVHMLYASANRDDDVFGPNAAELDVARQPNPHLAFGFGAHFCVGAALARIEAAAVWTALLDRFGGIEVGATALSPSTIISGHTSAQVTFRPARAS